MTRGFFFGTEKSNLIVFVLSVNFSYMDVSQALLQNMECFHMPVFSLFLFVGFYLSGLVFDEGLKANFLRLV
jgi:hypothetical protein